MDDELRAWLRGAISDRLCIEHPDGWAHTVCVVAARVANVDATALTLHWVTGVQEVLAVSDEWARTVVALRYSVGEGPGEQAYVRGRPVLVPDVGVDQARWPGFAEAALGEGVRAVFAFPLVIGRIRLGTLELFRRRPGELSGPARADAIGLASLAIDAILNDAETARREGRQWPSPALSSHDVHIAIGMLAVQLHLSVADAFARLRAHAYAEQRPMLDVARDVLRRRISLEDLRD